MPKAQKGNGVNKYPGLKEFATRVYRQTPSTQHDSLRLELNYFVNQAKLTGEATSMNWTTQTLQTLKARFGSPSVSPFNPVKMSPQSVNGNASKLTFTGSDHTMGGNSQSNSIKSRGSQGKQRNEDVSSSLNTKGSYLQDAQSKKMEKIDLALNPPPKINSKEAIPSRVSNQGAMNSRASIKESDKGTEVPTNFTGSDSKLSYAKSSSPFTAYNIGSKQQRPFKAEPLSHTMPKKRQVNQGIAKRRRERFESPSVSESPYMELHTGGPIVGTSQKLEKSYFRLTGQVNANVVRPPDVIRRALKFVFGKYELDRSNYSYISDQFKSLRQDLTVQHIVSSLTVRVYEYNARVALEHDDLGEYNQCSAQLHELYTQARELVDKQEASQMLLNEKEFQAYVIYYKIYVGAWEELGILLRELNNDADTDLSQKPRDAPSLMLARALSCITIVTTRQNSALFACWRESTPLEHKLIGKFAVREQLRALEAMVRATLQQNQTLPLNFVARGIGLTTSEEVGGFLETWKVPHNGTYISSADALPLINQAVNMMSGPADIKGQI